MSSMLEEGFTGESNSGGVEGPLDSGDESVEEESRPTWAVIFGGEVRVRVMLGGE